MQKSPAREQSRGAFSWDEFARSTDGAREETLFCGSFFRGRGRSSGALGAFSGALFRFGVRLAFFRIVAVLSLH